MVEKAKVTYTLEGRLAEVLCMYPILRGSLWFAQEEVWEKANPSYAEIRGKDRRGHFALSMATLKAANPTSIHLLHGHSRTDRHEEWFHLQVTGLTATEPTRTTWFDVWHRYPVAWREFFSGRVSRNLDKKALTEAEEARLNEIESRIWNKTRSDHADAVFQYQHHPAWKQHFPEFPPSEILDGHGTEQA